MDTMHTVLLPRRTAGARPTRAVLAGTVETAVNALWDAAPLLGDRVTVVGAGMVGCCVACLLSRFPAVQVTLVDVDAGRADVAAALGVDFALPADAAGEALYWYDGGTRRPLRVDESRVARFDATGKSARLDEVVVSAQAGRKDPAATAAVSPVLRDATGQPRAGSPGAHSDRSLRRRRRRGQRRSRDPRAGVRGSWPRWWR